MPVRPLIFACALLFAVALAGACKTEDVHPNVVPIDPGATTGIWFYLIRDDAYGPDGAATHKQLPIYRVTVDGGYLTFGESTYVEGGSVWVLPVAVGTHVVGVVDQQGNALAVSAPIERKALPFYQPAVVFFGGPTTLRARVLINDPAALPAGAVHLRVVNTFVDHRSLQVVQCLTDLDATPVAHTAGTCTPMGAPIPYGDVFEMDAGADIVNKIGFSWDPPGTVDAPVQGINAAGGYVMEGASPSFRTRMPVAVLDPASRGCPTCFLAMF